MKYIILLLLINIQLLNSQCSKPGTCTKKYGYLTCPGFQQVCSYNPGSNIYRAPNPICLKFIGNGPATAELQQKTGQFIKVYDRNQVQSDLNLTMSKWNCICDKQNTACACEVYVGWSDNYKDFDEDVNKAKGVLAQCKLAAQNCVTKCGSFDPGYNRILLNNSEECTGAKPSATRKVKFLATNDFFNDLQFEYFKNNRLNGTKFYDLEGVIGHEAGHAMGLMHHDDDPPMCDPTSTGMMSRYATPYIKYVLSDDDKCQYMKLYCPNNIGTSVQDNEQVELIKEKYLFPNPANNNIVLEIPPYMYNSEFKINIIDQLGSQKQDIQYSKNIFSNKFYLELDVSKLSSGIYFVSLSNDDFIATFKFLIERN